MGISRAWLAVAALALGSVQGDSVTFSTTSGFDSSFHIDAAVFSLAGVETRIFEWTTLQGITVENVTLWGKHPFGPIPRGRALGDGLENISTSKTSSSGVDTHETEETTPDPRGSGRRNPQSDAEGAEITVVPLTVNIDSNGGRVSFQGSRGIPADQLLYFRAKWVNGYSYSRIFSFANNRPSVIDESLWSTSPAYDEEGEATDKDGQSLQTTTASAVIATTSAGEEPTNVSAGDQGDLPNRPTQEGEPANAGLASGAIIGIAVGCGVAGLLLILGLVWYLLRRRRQKKAMHPVDSTYGTGNRGEELMAEKEASADVDVTPHSPYSDDGAPGGSGTGPNSGGAYPDSTTAAHGDGAAAAAVAAGAMAAPNLSHLQDPPRSFTPYSDRPSVGGTAATAAGTPSLRAPSLAQTDEARVSVPSPIPGRATPRGLTTPYAHLVEEGMTEDEIRRLEDEERQLDAAIEQAGRR